MLSADEKKIFEEAAVEARDVQRKAARAMTEKSRKGGKGVWGPVPMPPNPVSKISDADLKAAVEWILKQ